MITETDYLVIGSGIAGLTFAIKIATQFPEKTIIIVTKSAEEESNTKYAQGGIAVVHNFEEDNFNMHINDTLICGDGLCNLEVVEMVVKDGPKRVLELIDWGANFDKNIAGNLDLGREGGHTKNRVVHHKDHTGIEIERIILEETHRSKNIILLDFHFALELIVKNNRCLGSYVLNEKTNEILIFKADFTILATGGIGQVYGHTTNPIIATGDGIAMANRAKAKIMDMEFIQFHPTALYTKEHKSTFLISEAVRGFGAYLRTKNGKRFMLDYDSRGELASRDIVSRSIVKELKKSKDVCVYLDCTHLDLAAFKKQFPVIYSRCKEVGIEIFFNWIPVVPAQHYLCGGISVDLNGQTTVANLFACGECSRTGLHGANRLASNSLLEALVYSERIYRHLSEASFKIETRKDDFLSWHESDKPILDEHYISDTTMLLQSLMQQNVGVVRNNIDLNSAKRQLEIWKKEVSKMIVDYTITKEMYELLNMIEVSLLIVTASISRDQNCGGFVKI
ncbi:MAG: L-aspartate oxidase [Flavobacterium sp.]|nr:L-aspartate oxidase [Flavobacterium sp.]